MKNGISEMLAVADRSTVWNRLTQQTLLALLATGLLAVPTMAFSATVVLDFEGLVGEIPDVTSPIPNTTPVDNFYIADGVSFSPNGLALVHESVYGAGGTWNQNLLAGGNASDMALFSGDGLNINVESTAGFNSFSLSYSTLVSPLFVNVYAANSSSSFVSFQLSNLSNPPGETWTTLSSGALSQTAFRLELAGGGVLGNVAYDDITLNPAPVPLPAAAWLLLSGLAGLGFVGRRRTAK